ncbi:helix-turn-helix domain-containing protein [Rummeliibacillus sp. JY-2-4R]
MIKQQNNAVIQSLATGIDLLDVIIHQEKPLKFTEIQALSDLKTSNLYKYLSTLAEANLIQKNSKENTFSPGPKLLEWQQSIARKQVPFIDELISNLEHLSTITDLTTLIAIPSSEGPIVSGIHHSLYGVNIGAQMGSYLPLASSTGVVQAAFDPNFSKSISESIILEKIINTQKNSFASYKEPLVQYISSCSMPIILNEQLVAILTLVGFTPLIPEDSKDERIVKCMEFIDSLSKQKT